MKLVCPQDPCLLARTGITCPADLCDIEQGVEPDPFDPRFWDLEPPHEFRIYGDERASCWAVVDEIDYQWAIRHRWCPNRKRKKGRIGFKTYLHRAVGENANGVRLRTSSLYLHVEILKRAVPERPSPLHTIADHRDGDTWNCRRSNLRWATPSMNSKNVWGRMAHDLVEG